MGLLNAHGGAMIVFDTNTAALIAAIGGLLAALTTSFSVIYSARTLRTITKQTEILTKQFDIAEQARKESARPRLNVELSNYKPPDSGQMRGDVTFTLRNIGSVTFRVVKVESQSGNTKNQDLALSIYVYPGSTAPIVANLQPPENYNPPVLKAWFDIETPDGIGHRCAAAWEVRRGYFILLTFQVTTKDAL